MVISGKCGGRALTFRYKRQILWRTAHWRAGNRLPRLGMPGEQAQVDWAGFGTIQVGRVEHRERSGSTTRTHIIHRDA
ncbi:MAG: hypothetical protein CME06_04870 [Gemmatimonadetes bacterium]|nr:hypothetical protein [Gemmatimonadota bacterium]